MRWLKIAFAAIAIVLAIDAIFSGNYNLMPYMIASLALMIIVIAVTEIRKRNMVMGIISAVISAFLLFVSIFTGVTA